VLRFRLVHFVNYNSERNQVCFKPVLRLRLWPSVAQLAATRRWDESLRTAGIENGQFTECAPTLSKNETQLPVQFDHVKRFAFMKIVGAKGSAGIATSPDRSFLYSKRFSTLLCDKGILEAPPVLPLLERMWHVNTAEMIVTTWGSAMATITNLLMPRRRAAVDGSLPHEFRNMSVADPQFPQQRILVLVHPSYCHEVFVLKVPYKSCSQLTRSPSAMFTNTISMHRHAPTDFIGGPDFCVKYLLVSSLRYVVSRDLDFSCPR
jgi:hypothetical protein